MTKIEERREKCAVYQKTVDELEATVYDKDKGLVEQNTNIRLDMVDIKSAIRQLKWFNGVIMLAMVSGAVKIIFFGVS